MVAIALQYPILLVECTDSVSSTTTSVALWPEFSPFLGIFIIISVSVLDLFEICFNKYSFL